MNYYPIILGDLLLAAMAFYGVLSCINYVSKRHRKTSSKELLFPKMAAVRRKENDPQ